MSWLPTDPEARVYLALFVLFLILFVWMTGSMRRAWDKVDRERGDLHKARRALSTEVSARKFWRDRAERAEMALWSTDLSAPRHDSYLTDGSGGQFQHREPVTREQNGRETRPPTMREAFHGLDREDSDRREQAKRDPMADQLAAGIGTYQEPHRQLDLDEHFASTPAASATTTAPLVTCTCRWGDAVSLWACPVHAVRPPINGSPLVDGEAT